MLSQNKQRTRVLAAFAGPELFNVSGLKNSAIEALRYLAQTIKEVWAVILSFSKYVQAQPAARRIFLYG